MKLKLIVGGVFGVVVLLVIAGFVWVSRTASASPGDSTTPVVFTIKPGEGVRTVSDKLKRQNLIVSEQAWTLYVILTGRRSALFEGEYTLNQAMTGREIATLFGDGKIDIDEVEIKIVEGMTAKAMATQLDTAGVISDADFMAAIAVPDSRDVIPNVTYEFLRSKPSSVDLEGYLFPDTYRFFRNSSAATVLRKFLDNFDARYTPAMRASTTAQGRTIFEIVTMASILEAELRTDTDRAMASDIFWRRLEAGIALNADATVQYAVGKIGTTTPLTSDDLEFVSPYNTYLNRGLPVGPIGNPGVSSLRAAITPKPNDYWYYLSAPNGKTIYAKTLEEHNANVAQYLR